MGHIKGLALKLTVYDDWRAPEFNALAIPNGSVVIYTTFLDAIDRTHGASSRREGALAFVVCHEVWPAYWPANAQHTSTGCVVPMSFC